MVSALLPLMAEEEAVAATEDPAHVILLPLATAKGLMDITAQTQTQAIAALASIDFY